MSVKFSFSGLTGFGTVKIKSDGTVKIKGYNSAGQKVKTKVKGCDSISAALAQSGFAQTPTSEPGKGKEKTE